ncbi:suppressor of fused domain protein [Pendulispora brunnea]|uniref:Suppressor of fused domain protein n=1 Tax=Pendulispora brunnea TaxID=2905690 RepID=A0ABZ2K467_9BACT
MTSTDDVRAHYEKLLGSATEEHRVNLGPLQFEILTIPGAPYADGTTVATLGLSKHIGQEFLLACHSDQLHAKHVSLLAIVAKEQLESGAGLRRGQVLGPAGPLVPGAATEALYVCPPAYFGPNFDPLILADGGHVHFFWLVPIHVREARWIAVNDTPNTKTFVFEDLLVAQDPDLLDFSRPELDLGDSN